MILDEHAECKIEIEALRAELADVLDQLAFQRKATQEINGEADRLREERDGALRRGDRLMMELDATPEPFDFVGWLRKRANDASHGGAEELRSAAEAFAREHPGPVTAVRKAVR